MRKIAIANQKGGVGKTTLAVNLCHALSELKKRVLLIDADPQGNATVHLGNEQSETSGLERFLNNEISFEDTLQNYNGAFDYLPSGKKLVNMESRLHKMDAGNPERYYTIKNALREINLYDYIIIDCMPSLGLLTVNVLAYCEIVLIPIQCHYFALEGTGRMIDVINDVRRLYNNDLKIGAVIPVMYDKRNKISEYVTDKLTEHFSDRVTKTRIRVNVALAEAPLFGQTIFDYQKSSHGAQDFKKLAKELLNI